MAAHTHWRITCDGLDYVQLAEVAFLSAGLADLSVGGTASASSEYSFAFPASAAFDKNASGSWWCTATGSLPAWLAYAHPTAVEPVYVSITAHPTYPPISLGLQHSDDGITWSAAVPLIFSSGGPIASGAATVFVPSVGRRPIVWQSNEVRELPAGDKLPADVIPSHGHAMGDVAGLDAALGAKEASIAAGATTEYFRGDKTWRTFMTDVRATTLSGLSTATSAVIAAGDTVLTALGKLQAQITGHKGAASAAHTATAISNVPAGGVSATNVQAAINELDSEKANAASVREKLTAAITYYVRTDGSDSNSGLTNTAGGAFLTIQKAVDVCAALDLGIYDATIMVGAGTWTAATTLKTLVGAGKVIIRGVNDDMTSTVISVSGSGCFSGAFVGQYKISHMRLTCTGECIDIFGAGAIVRWSDVDFAAATVHVRAFTGALGESAGNYKISGSAYSHIAVHDCGNVRVVGSSVTITGTPNFSGAFCLASRLGNALVVSAVFSGSATGARYSSGQNSVIYTGAGELYLPGDAAGGKSTGGHYE